MRRLSILSIMGLLFALLLVTGCGTILVTKDGGSGAGNIEDRRYELTDFTEIEIDSTFHYTIEQSDTYSVVIEADSSSFDDITVEKSGQKLIVSSDFPRFYVGLFIGGSYPRVTITVPVLTTLDCSGTTHGKLIGFDLSDKLQIKVSGASDLEIWPIIVPEIDIDIDGSSDVKLVDLESTDVTITLSGASDLDGSIVADYLDIGISGSSDIDCIGEVRSLTLKGSGVSGTEFERMVVKDASVILSGSSDCELTVTDNLDAVISGTSSLEYVGDPTLGTIDISASGDLKKR